MSLLGLLFWMGLAQAGDLSLGYGLGIEKNSPLAFDAQVKNASLSYQSDIWKAFKWKLEAGAFVDNDRQTTTGFGFAQAGPQIQPMRWFYLENMLGLGMISKTDDLLGSYFQFGIDLGVGFIEPMSGTKLGAQCKHISNGGLEKPNHGRNNCQVRLSVCL